LRPDEFLIVGFDAALEFKPSMGLEFTGAQFLLVEAGLSGSVVQKPTEIPNRDFASRGLYSSLGRSDDTG